MHNGPMFNLGKTKRIYMDYAGQTPMSEAAVVAYTAALSTYANPGALHREGMAAATLLEKARKDIAYLMECKKNEVTFTSGATESNNIIMQYVRAQEKGAHVVVSSIEHASILEPARQLEREGYRVTYLAPGPDGRITAGMLVAALTPHTVFVSIGWANSETGIVQPIHHLTTQVRAYEKEKGTTILFHSDAGQAPLYLPAMVSGLGVDALSLDAGKLYGPRGIGALYVRQGFAVPPLMHGGGQEHGMRPGTEPVALAAGFGVAARSARDQYKLQAAHTAALRAVFLDAIKRTIPDVVVNECKDHQLLAIVNISVPEIDPEYVVLRMDAEGVALSTKSACEESARESHVVRAYAADSDAWRARTTLRFSFGCDTTEAEVRRVVPIVGAAVALSRSVAQN